MSALIHPGMIELLPWGFTLGGINRRIANICSPVGMVSNRAKCLIANLLNQRFEEHLGRFRADPRPGKLYRALLFL